MKVLKVLFILIVLLCIKLNANDDWPVLKGPYLGQKPPGMVPEVFAPGILNTEKMGAFCSVFSPDGTEFYFVYHNRVDDSGGISWMKKQNEIWTEPQRLHFSSRGNDNDMCMSADGSILIFRSWRALPDGNKPKDHSYLWFVNRTENGWSVARPLLCGGVLVRTGYPSLSQSNTLYFAHRQNGRLGIYRSKLTAEKYSSPEFVYTVFSQEYIHGDMFVAPDESFMIVSGKDPQEKIGQGGLDLHIIFRKPDGSWSKAINMGDKINTRYGENCPQVSPDGKYFFFNRYNPELKMGNIYWVDARYIEKLRKSCM